MSGAQQVISSVDFKVELENLIPSCESVLIISSYVTSPAVKLLSELVCNDKCNVTVIGRFSPADLGCGASDINALEMVIEKGWELRALRNLHAKIYVIDNSISFVGSANFTNNGLSIVGFGNVEALVKLDVDGSISDFVNMILRTSSEIDKEVLDLMRDYTGKTNNTKNTYPQYWPDNILKESGRIFVSDFPVCDQILSNYNAGEILIFNQISDLIGKGDKRVAEELFLNSKAYAWLINLLQKNDRRMFYGEITKVLHDELEDDPAPYRSDVKKLLTNLLSYVDKFSVCSVRVTRPRHSQLVELLD